MKDQPKSTNIAGAIKCKQYPTTQFLRQSVMKAKRSDDDESAASGIASEADSQKTGGPNFDSDFSEAFSI